MRNASFSAWSGLGKILAVRLDAMGDVLMTEPAIRALKESTDASITLLTSPSGAEAGKLLGELDEILIYESPWMKASAARKGSQLDRDFVETLRARRFDAAVIFTVYSQNPLASALMCHWADIPLRLAHCRENPYQLLSHWVPEPEPQSLIRHEVRRQLDLVASIGCRTQHESIQLRIQDGDRKSCWQKIRQAGGDRQRPFLVMHTGATAASRRYPPEKFTEAIEILLQTSDHQIFLTGTEGEREVIERICSHHPRNCIPLVGRLSLAEFAALLESCDLLISNNTGAVHLGAGAGCKIVDLYALTNPQHTPWMVPNRVLNQDVDCKYCYKSVCPEGHHRCLQDVSPAAVAEAALQLMAQTEVEGKAAVYA